jgi:antitoxin CptB
MNQLVRLQWQCRRGTKELDLLLQRYLETGYLSANDEEKALFVEMLELEDDELIRVLMGELEMRVEGVDIMVEKIRMLSNRNFQPSS